MHYFGSGSKVPAISRKIIETDLIEKYHWLPQDLDKISYKRLQEHLLIVRQRNEANQSKVQVEKSKQQNRGLSSSQGQRRRIIREI